jgi:coenzyme F420 hydrogenase subunit delta
MVPEDLTGGAGPAKLAMLAIGAAMGIAEGDSTGCDVPEIYRAPILVLGCGNLLFGDDGFGPAVAERMKAEYRVPPGVAVLDAGTGVRDVLFDVVLGERRPEKIVIVDAVDLPGREPGEVFLIAVSELPVNKLDDFSLHQVPTSNLLRELEESCGVKVTVVAGQVERIPLEVSPGLSPVMARSVSKACALVMGEIAAAQAGGSR